jgi:hypothetical protein
LRTAMPILAAAVGGAALGVWMWRPDEGSQLRARLTEAANALPAPAALPQTPPSAVDRIESAEALRAGEQGVLWTIVRRELGRAPHPAARALAEAAERHATALRAFRAGEASIPLRDLERAGGALVARIEGAALINPVIAAQFARLEGLGAATTAVPSAPRPASPAP